MYYVDEFLICRFHYFIFVVFMNLLFHFLFLKSIHSIHSPFVSLSLPLFSFNLQNVLLIAITESIKFDDRALKLGSGTIPIPSPINCCSHDADDKSQQTEQTTCEPSPLSMPPPQDSPQTELAPRKRRRKRDDPQSCVTNAEVSIITTPTQFTKKKKKEFIFTRFTHSFAVLIRPYLCLDKIKCVRKQVNCRHQLIM